MLHPAPSHSVQNPRFTSRRMSRLLPVCRLIRFQFCATRAEVVFGLSALCAFDEPPSHLEMRQAGVIAHPYRIGEAQALLPVRPRVRVPPLGELVAALDAQRLD